MLEIKASTDEYEAELMTSYTLGKLGFNAFYFLNTTYESGTHRGAASIRLTPEQAKQLRDELNEFLSKVGE